MKIASYATRVACLLLIGVTTPLFAQLGAPGAARPPVGGLPAAAAPAAAPSSGMGTMVAVIDIPYIFKNHVRFKQSMDGFKNQVDEFEAWARNEQKKLTQIRDEIIAQYKPNTDQFKSEEERLAKLTSDLQIRMTVKKREFLENEAKVYYATYNEVIAAVSQFAERNRIGLVLRFNGDEIDPTDRGSVLQGVNRAVVYQRNLDISDLILTMVNGSAPQTPVAPPSGGGGPVGGTAQRPGLQQPPLR